MKIKLTQKWTNRPYSRTSTAGWKNIFLECSYCYHVRADRWIGSASLAGIHQRKGPVRNSVKLARRDAERLAIEVLLDIRDGVEILMKTHQYTE